MAYTEQPIQEGMDFKQVAENLTGNDSALRLQTTDVDTRGAHYEKIGETSAIFTANSPMKCAKIPISNYLEYES